MDTGSQDQLINCTHIKICYFIWDKQEIKNTDPVDFGSIYRNHVHNVYLSANKLDSG